MAELKKLGRYELRRVLGKGAMGVVYEGYDPTLSRRVAVKTILKSVAHDDETERDYAERFVREAKAVARLNHANIVQVFDFGVENEAAYLVMEFIQGRELRDFFVVGEAFEVDESVRIMGELLDALEFAHEAGVIHRDVKPANVMLDARRRVKLADFGVARVQDSDRSAAGTMVGTPAFMSPEQISGGKVDRRTDIFSAGNILYQLLTGEQPFKGEGAWTVARQIMQDDPPAPSSVVKSVSAAFDAIVQKALAKSPAQRFASAGEFAASLRGAALPSVVGSKARALPQASETELEFWRAIQNSTDAAEFEFYLEQFPEGTYSRLARHKIAKLTEPIEAVRKEDEEKAQQEVDERARKEAQAGAKREAEEKAERETAAEAARRHAEETRRRQADEQARMEAEARARREAEERARQVAEEKAKREALERARRGAEQKTRDAAIEKSKRESAEKLRQAQAAAATIKAQSAEPIGAGKAAEISSPPASRTPSYLFPVAGVVIAIVAGIGAYLFLGRTQAPAPVVEAPATPGIDNARKEAEERARRELADQAAAEKAAAELAAAKKAAAERVAAEKAVAGKAVAEAAAAKAAAEKAAAKKMAAERAATEKSAAEKLAAERAAAEQAAAEKRAADRAAEKAALDRAAAEKAALEKAAAEKLAAEKAAIAKAAAAKAAAEKADNEPPFDGIWRGEAGIWRVHVTVTGNRVEGTLICSQKPNTPLFAGTLKPDGTVQAEMKGEYGGWNFREIEGKFPFLRIVSSGWMRECADGNVRVRRWR